MFQCPGELINPDSSTFDKDVEHRLVDLGITRKQLAELTDVPKASIYSAIREFSNKRAIRVVIAEALNRLSHRPAVQSNRESA